MNSVFIGLHAKDETEAGISRACFVPDGGTGVKANFPADLVIFPITPPLGNHIGWMGVLYK